MRLLSLLVLSLLAILTFGFAMFNAQNVSINYYLGTRDLPLSLLLVSTLLGGVILGFCLWLPTYLRLKFEIRRLRHKEGN